MRFFLVDDDEVVRSMLNEMIEDHGFGEVVGEAEDGSEINEELLALRKVDVLMIDLLMPHQDGLETLRKLPNFKGKVIMISQIESKDMIGKAYSLGVQYYITKPLNRLEVTGVLKWVTEHLKLEQSILAIRKSILSLDNGIQETESPFTKKDILTSGRFLLTDLGIISESGSKDLLAILHYLYQLDKEKPVENDFPLLKDLLYHVAKQYVGAHAEPKKIQRESKAIEQRIRRAIEQSLTNLASIGLTDYANPIFERYASTFFDFAEVRKKMTLLQEESPSLRTRINMKRFIQVLYFEAKQAIQA